MDFTKYDLGMANKIYLHNTQDLGSRYKFLPMAGGYPVGEEVAAYLSEKFDRLSRSMVLPRPSLQETRTLFCLHPGPSLFLA